MVGGYTPPHSFTLIKILCLSLVLKQSLYWIKFPETLLETRADGKI